MSVISHDFPRPIFTIKGSFNIVGNLRYAAYLQDDHVQFIQWLNTTDGGNLLVNGVPPWGKYTRESYDRLLSALVKLGSR